MLVWQLWYCNLSISFHIPNLPSPLLTSPLLTSPQLTSPQLTSTHLTSTHLTSPHLTQLLSQITLLRVFSYSKLFLISFLFSSFFKDGLKNFNFSNILFFCFVVDISRSLIWETNDFPLSPQGPFFALYLF